MARPKLYNDEEKKERKREANNKEENIKKRRLNALKYYEKIKLKEYIIKNGNDEGFEYKYINMTFDDYKNL
jgi:hypothetical protein